MRVMSNLCAAIAVLVACSLFVTAEARSADARPAHGEATMNTDTLYMKIVDCALPPVAFSSIADAFKTESLISGFLSMVPSKRGADVLRQSMEEAKKALKPEALFKRRLSEYFKTRFSPADAQKIVESCAEGAGFTDKELYDRFQETLNGMSLVARREAVMITIRLMGDFLALAAKNLEPLSASDLGITDK